MGITPSSQLCCRLGFSLFSVALQHGFPLCLRASPSLQANIMLESGKEIDLLAFNTITREKFHIEVRVATGKGFRLRLIDTQTKKGRKHRRGLDTLSAIKFAHPTVFNAVKEIFGSGEYKKTLVVWDVEDSRVVEQARNIYNIEIWKMADLMNQLMQEVKTKPYRIND